MNYLTAAICLYLCFSLHKAWAFELSDVRVPSGTETSWVGRGIEHNGVTMDVKLLKSNYSSAQLLKFYKNMWESDGGEGVGYAVGEVGDYKLISKIIDTHNVVVQLRNNNSGHAEGYLSSIDLASLASADSDDDFPMLSNTMIISKTVSTDSSKSAVTRVLINNYSVASNAEFYRSTFESDGWKKSYATDPGKSFMALYSKNNKKMELAISKEPGNETVIFVNIVEDN